MRMVRLYGFLVLLAIGGAADAKLYFSSDGLHLITDFDVKVIDDAVGKC